MLCAFLRQIYLNNRKNVPTDKPVLLAANHPTAFFDPIVMCSFFHPPLYNMTRGDIFRKKLYRMLMESINMFPVYRVRDGYISRERNDEVFEYCIGKLKQRRVVTIYVEGEHHLEKRVRPAQKGLARIAFAAYERNRQEDLMVLPVGCNYWYGDRQGDTVLVEVGQPILIRDYWELYNQSQAMAINRLTQEIEQRLREICYHIDNPDDYELAEQMLTIHRGNWPTRLFPQVVNNSNRFQEEKRLLNRLNEMSGEEKQALKIAADHYFQALNRAGIDDAALAHPSRAGWMNTIQMVVTFPLYLVGILTSAPIRWVGFKITRKTVRKQEFYTSVLFGAAFIFAHLFYNFILIGSIISLNPWAIAIALALPLFGWFSSLYENGFRDWIGARKARRHPDRGALLSLRQHYKSLLERVQIFEKRIEE